MHKLMHVDDYKVREFPTCTNIDGELRSRSVPRLCFWYTFGFGLSAIERRRKQTTLISRQTRREYISSPTGPDCAQARAAAGSSLGSNAVCADATEYEMQQDCVHGENNGRPRDWIRCTCAHWRQGRGGIVRSRQIYRAPWNVYCAEHDLSPGSNILRSHFDYSSLLRPLSRNINILNLNGVPRYLRGSELHRFIMLRIPSADNHVLRATRFAWNSSRSAWQGSQTPTKTTRKIHVDAM